MVKSGVTGAFTVFTNRASDSLTSWFNQDMLSNSSWSDLKTSSYNFFSFEGYATWIARVLCQAIFMQMRLQTRHIKIERRHC